VIPSLHIEVRTRTLPDANRAPARGLMRVLWMRTEWEGWPRRARSKLWWYLLVFGQPVNLVSGHVRTVYLGQFQL
jgi:hypothetical protein